MTKYFDENVYPVLTPLAVDPGHPFPMISNLSLKTLRSTYATTSPVRNVARAQGAQFTASFPPGQRDAVVPVGRPHHVEPGRLFSGMTVGRRPLSRDAKRDLSLEEDEADDLLVALEVELRRRRFGEALRVEIQSGMSPGVPRAPRRPTRTRSLQRVRHRRAAGSARPLEPLRDRSTGPEGEGWSPINAAPAPRR